MPIPFLSLPGADSIQVSILLVAVAGEIFFLVDLAFPSSCFLPRWARPEDHITRIILLARLKVAKIEGTKKPTKMVAPGGRRRGAVLVALLAVAAVTARVAAADDFFSPFAPMLSPIINSICKTVACGKGNCTVEQGTVLGYRCECDPGWTQMHIGDSLRFLPCVVPNCCRF